MEWKNQLTKTPYLVLFIILIAVGVGTASALVTITLSGNVLITGFLDMMGDKITNVGVPTLSTDAATKGYVDSAPDSDTLAGLGCASNQVVRWTGSQFSCDFIIVLEISQSKVIVSSGNTGHTSSIAIASGGIPVISSLDIDGPNNLQLAVCNNRQCTSPTVITVDSFNDVSHGSEVVLTSNNIPIIAYASRTNDDLKLAVCNDTLCTSPTLSTITSVDDVIDSFDIVLTSNDIPIITYRDEITDQLKLAVCNNTACTSPTITTLDSSGNVGREPAIVLASGDKPVIAYGNLDTRDLMLIVCNDAACTSPSPIIVDSTTWAGVNNDIALASGDKPVISYRDKTSQNSKIAVCNDAACTSPTLNPVDTAGNAGFDTRLALTRDDMPIILSTTFVSGQVDIRLAVCNDTTCTSPTLTTIESTGISSSDDPGLALLGDTQFISYRATGGNLKLFVDGGHELFFD